MSNKTGSKKHTHKYECIDGNWSCAKSNCTHMLPKNYRRGIPLGLESICWDCGSEFIIDAISINKARPICDNCDIENPLRLIGQVVNME